MWKIVYYLTPSGFCFGVKRSIDQLQNVIEKHAGERVFCVHKIVHNSTITKEFEQQGVVFVENIDDIWYNNQAIVVFSAHGTNREIINQAKQKFKAVYNLECPFVTKVYTEIDGFIQQGVTTFFYIGQNEHRECKNILEYIISQWWNAHIFDTKESLPQIDKKNKVAVLSQTTLNFAYVKDMLDEIQKQYFNAILPTTSDICKATYERQTVIMQNLQNFNTLIVIGSKESNNSKKLYNIGIQNDKKSFYGESLEDILQYPEEELFANETVAITWWASTPIEDIKEVFDYYKNHGYKPEMLELQ